MAYFNTFGVNMSSGLENCASIISYMLLDCYLVVFAFLEVVGFFVF